MLEQSKSDVLVPIWKVPVFARLSLLCRCRCCSGQEQSWAAGRRPLASLLEAALSCYCPKLPTPPFPWGLVLPQHLSCLLANPQVQLWPWKGVTLCRAAAACPSSEPVESAWKALTSSSQVEQTAGKRVWCVTARFTSAPSTIGEYSQHPCTHTPGNSLAPQLSVSFSQGYH